MLSNEPRNNPWIIAEAGSCHEGDLGRGIQLIDVAWKAGADAVKFQFWSSPAEMRRRRKIADPTAYEQGSIKPEWFEILKDKAEELGLAFMCTVYCPQDVELAAKYIDAWKISSFEAGSKSLAAEVWKYLEETPRRPIFVSTGMGKFPVKNLWPSWTVELHCVSAYPCPLPEASLASIPAGGGYSDHTRAITTGAFAVCAGAQYLEVHFRLDDTLTTCPDYPVALDPSQLKAYVSLARTARSMMGTATNLPQPSEWSSMDSLVLE